MREEWEEAKKAYRAQKDRGKGTEGKLGRTRRRDGRKEGAIMDRKRPKQARESMPAGGHVSAVLDAAGRRLWADIRAFYGFGLLLLFYTVVSRLLWGAFCPWRIVTGLPCPGCGMTRAILCFVTGHFSKGLAYHPLGIGWLILGFYFVLSRYFLGRKPKGVLQAGGVLCVCMLVLYLVRMYRDFPGAPPICYEPRNLLEKHFPGYRDFILGLFSRH